jgi:hypothetical protein
VLSATHLAAIACLITPWQVPVERFVVPATLAPAGCDACWSTVIEQSVVLGERITGTCRPAAPPGLIEAVFALVDPLLLTDVKPVSTAVMGDTPVPPQTPKWEWLPLV